MKLECTHIECHFYNDKYKINCEEVHYPTDKPLHAKGCPLNSQPPTSSPDEPPECQDCDVRYECNSGLGCIQKMSPKPSTPEPPKEPGRYGLPLDIGSFDLKFRVSVYRKKDGLYFKLLRREINVAAFGFGYRDARWQGPKEPT